MDKIYSRSRIRIPRLKHTRKSSFSMLILGIFLIVLASICYFIVISYPIFVASCKTAAVSKAVNIMTDEVNSVMVNYDYNDLVDIEKNEDGKVMLMKANVVLMNKIISTITKNIQVRIDQSPTTMVYINYGSVSGISILKNFGPKFDIELETAGRVNTQTKSEFESVGVNQTLHRIYLEIDIKIGILTPIGTYSEDANSTVLLTEAIIVGEVPTNYYNLEGLNKEDALEVVE